MQGGRDQEAVEGLFERARQAGASAGTADDLRPAEQQSRSSAFVGRARTLAGNAEPASDAAAQDAAAPASDPNAPVVHTITFYQNGIFTVDDGTASLHMILDVHERIPTEMRHAQFTGHMLSIMHDAYSKQTIKF